MAINIFEGARRVTKLVGGLWVAGCLVYLFFLDAPSIYLTYATVAPNKPLVRTELSCGYEENASEYVTVKTTKGTSAQVKLCFLAALGSNGSKAVPFRIDPQTGEWWGNSPHSQEVKAYTKQVGDNFRLPKDDEQWVDSRWWPERFQQIRELAQVLCLGAFFIWGITWAIGWIVRGFLGIPSGADSKAAESNADA